MKGSAFVEEAPQYRPGPAARYQSSVLSEGGVLIPSKNWQKCVGNHSRAIMDPNLCNNRRVLCEDLKEVAKVCSSDPELIDPALLGLDYDSLSDGVEQSTDDDICFDLDECFVDGFTQDEDDRDFDLAMVDLFGDEHSCAEKNDNYSASTCIDKVSDLIDSFETQIQAEPETKISNACHKEPTQLLRRKRASHACRKSIYRGVSKASGNKWGAKFGGKRIFAASSCTTEEDAARAYDAYLKEHVPKKYLKFRNFCGDCGKFCNGLNLSSHPSQCVCGPQSKQPQRTTKPLQQKENTHTKREAVCSEIRSAKADETILDFPVVSLKKQRCGLALPSAAFATSLCIDNYLSVSQMRQLLCESAALADTSRANLDSL